MFTGKQWPTIENEKGKVVVGSSVLSCTCGVLMEQILLVILLQT